MEKPMKPDEIKACFAAVSIEDYPEVIRRFQADERKSVQSLLARMQKQVDAEAAEQARLEAMLTIEKAHEDVEFICGIDEAGRGPYAGPVVAGAVVLPKDCKIRYLNDSKKLSESKREQLYDEIMEKAIAVGVGVVGPERIDEINILQADYEAMREAIAQLSVKPGLLLNDAVTIPGVDIPQMNIVHGDAKSLSIAAASIIAKVTRDRMMVLYDQMYPEYGFAGHKGYGSKAHEEAIRKYGLCPIHRRSFTHKFIEE